MNNFLSCNLMGGLGNQMFQAAHVLCQGLKHNRPVYLRPNSWTPMQGKQTNEYSSKRKQQIVSCQETSIVDFWVEASKTHHMIFRMISNHVFAKKRSLRWVCANNHESWHKSWNEAQLVKLGVFQSWCQCEIEQRSDCASGCNYSQQRTKYKVPLSRVSQANK